MLNRTEKAGTAADAPSGRRALVVDDEAMVRAAVRTSLEIIFDYEVVEAGSASDAIRELNSAHYDLVVSDLRMTSDTGLDVLSFLRKASPTCPFVLFTGSRDGVAEDALASVTVVEKPDFTSLMRTVSTLGA